MRPSTSGAASTPPGRLLSRPSSPDRPSPDTGVLEAGGTPGSLLLVPPAPTGAPMALIVLLHGAGAEPGTVLPLLASHAAENSTLILAPKSVSYTWDVVLGGPGPDARALDAALTDAFERHAVDPSRIALAGFSDGASCALTLGVINGDLFRRVIAYSPGFVRPGTPSGSPDVFVSHGTADPVLPIDACSRRIVPLLRRSGYQVEYREFDGGHSVPPEIVAASLEGL